MELTSVASAEGSDGMFVQCEPAVAADKTLSEFFHTVKALQRSCSDLSALEHAWGDRERDLAGALESAKVDVHAALCDNVDTPRAVRALLVRCVVTACHAFALISLDACQGLVRACNAYVNAPATQGAPRVLLVQGAARFVSRILLILGCSWGGEASDADGDGTVNREAVLAPALDALLEFRCATRQASVLFAAHPPRSPAQRRHSRAGARWLVAAGAACGMRPAARRGTAGAWCARR